MSNQLSNISKNSALLVMDFQTIILNNFLPQESAGNVIRNTASLITAARTAGVPVSYRCDYQWRCAFYNRASV